LLEPAFRPKFFWVAPDFGVYFWPNA
jgi:hypothetical protein